MARSTRPAPNQSSAERNAVTPLPAARLATACSGCPPAGGDAPSPGGPVGRSGRRLVGTRVVKTDRLVVFGERAGIEKGALDLEQLGEAGQLEEAEHADRVALVRLREVVEGGDAVAAQAGQEIEHHHLRDLRDRD